MNILKCLVLYPKYHMTCVVISSAHCLKPHYFRVTELLDICINTYLQAGIVWATKKYFNSRKQSCDLRLQWIFNRGKVKPGSAVALLLIPYSLHNSKLSFDSETRHCVGTETNLVQLVRATKSLPNLTQQQAIFLFLLHYHNSVRQESCKVRVTPNTTTRQTGYQKCALSTIALTAGQFCSPTWGSSRP